MRVSAVVGVDIGTSSSKGALVGLDGRILARSVREHRVDRPQPGRVEMEASVWWDDFVETARDLLTGCDASVVAVGVSGMGPCALLTDGHDAPVRPAILYGVDTRATAQIKRLESELGGGAIMARCASSLSSQAVGPKLLWVSDNEQELFARARRLYMPSSWLVRHLTGEYVLDHHSASQCTPMYDIDALDWYRPWTTLIAPDLQLPDLRWPGETAGTVTAEAAAATGLPVGIPVITGTIDAWAEAISVGAHEVGDLMVMYGTTLFLVHTVKERLSHDSLWGTVGALPGTRSLAGGMATSGAVTAWLRALFGGPPYDDLMCEAKAAGVGASGLLLLPYFAGERTPVMDPSARGILAGLTLQHTRGDVYRAALEAVAFGARHNIETIEAAGGDVQRLVAVGGGTRGDLWTQIVCDVTGREQVIPTQTIGASYGSALLAAQAVSDASIAEWNPPSAVRRPFPELRDDYDELYDLYRDLFESSKHVAHALARRQERGPLHLSPAAPDVGGPT